MLLNCALKLVEEIILYHDARSKKHQITICQFTVDFKFYLFISGKLFVNRCLRRIVNIHWPEVISNEELWRRAEETEISIHIKRRKWNWIGHTLRKGHDIIERQVLDWNPQGQGKRGRPKQTWRRSVHNEALGEGKS